MSCENIELYSNKAALEEKANQIAKTAPKEYRQSVYLYFLARYFVSLYEAKFSEIPLQVWNEYRNALDHYFRHITSDGQGNHIDKLECHIQRAVLDVAKLFCHDSQSYVEQLLAKEDDKCLRLIDNGEFHTNLKTLHSKAIRCFSAAKTGDSALGAGATKDREVLSAYLDACYGFIELEELINDKRHAIDKLSSEMDSIKHEASKHAFKEHVIASLTAKLLYLIGGAIIASAVAYYWSEKDVDAVEVENISSTTTSNNSSEATESSKDEKVVSPITNQVNKPVPDKSK